MLFAFHNFKINALQGVTQARSQDFAVCGGVFWRLETTSNYLDLDFDRSSIKLSRFLSPNVGDLPQKKGIHQNWDAFSVQIYVISKKKKKFFSQAATQFFWSKSHLILDQLSSPIPLGGVIFSFLVQKSASKVPKTGCFAYSSGQ